MEEFSTRSVRLHTSEVVERELAEHGMRLSKDYELQLGRGISSCWLVDVASQNISERFFDKNWLGRI